MNAAKDLMAKQNERLGQAADLHEDKLAHHEIGIDLKAQSERKNESCAS